MTCPCLYPIILHVGETKYLAYPFDVIEENEGEIPIPSIEEREETGRKYKVLRYRDLHSEVKKYEVGEDHIVYAGCEKESLHCDSKSIFEVWHPIEEWDRIHNVIYK